MPYENISLFACVQPVEPKTKIYEIPVPEEKQIYSNWCVPASVLMCAEYFANDVAWSDYSFPYLTTEEKEKIIYLILKRFGETFYTSSQEGAPKSISYFLYNYLNISNENMALLLGTPFSNVF